MTLYEEKESYFSDKWKLAETSAETFYRELFPAGSFENEMGRLDEYPSTRLGNGFIVYARPDGLIRTRMVFDDHGDIFKFVDNSLAFMSPISYFGRNRTAANARQLFAMTFDLDEVGRAELSNLLDFWAYQDRIPMPTYVVNSGEGVHLYYIFTEPVPMTPGNQRLMKAVKYWYTDRLWNEDTSRLQDKQFQGLNQGFRLVGSLTKRGFRAKAYRTGERIDAEKFVDYVPHEMGLHYAPGVKLKLESKLTLAQAKEKYPDWYHQRIELKRPRETWTCNRALYDWWKKRIPEVKLHHRYFFIMGMTVYAVKCGITFDELSDDALACKSYFNSPKFEGVPFTDDDILSALEMYQDCYRTFPRTDISKTSGLEMRPNKRNGRKQDVHLKRARAVQKIDYPNNEWAGRKSYLVPVSAFRHAEPDATYKDFEELTHMKKSVFYKYKDGHDLPRDCKKVYDYLSKNPAARKCDVIRATGLSRPTVYKYFDRYKQNSQKSENDGDPS